MTKPVAATLTAPCGSTTVTNPAVCGVGAVTVLTRMPVVDAVAVGLPGVAVASVEVVDGSVDAVSGAALVTVLTEVVAGSVVAAGETTGAADTAGKTGGGAAGKVTTSSGEISLTMFMVFPPSFAFGTGLTACVIA